MSICAHSPRRQRAAGVRKTRRVDVQTRTLAQTGLQPRGEFGALLNRTLGVQFDRQRGTAYDVWLNALLPQAFLEIAHRLLARADHDVVDLEHPRAGSLLAKADIQAAVVNSLIVHTRKLLHLLGFQ